MKKTAILFPGQGSQYLGMGGEFLQVSEKAREIMALAEEVSGAPLERLCAEGPMEELTRARNLQPALTAVNMICWEALRALLPDFTPAFVAGHSLGEYSALYAADVLTARDCLALVTRRGELMQREGEKNPGGMRAVIGLSVEEIQDLLKECQDQGQVVVANHNTASQIVLSGDQEGLDAMQALCGERGARVVALNVSVANHSPLVAGAVPDFQAFMEEIVFRRPRIPVIFNATAAPEDDPGAIRAIMARQIASPVRWHESMLRVLDAGVEVVAELGPKKVLTGLMKKITPAGSGIQRVQADSPAGLEKLAARISG